MTKKNQVRSYYDQYSSNYDTFYGPIQKDKFHQIQSSIPPNTLIFDLGGGSGIAAEWVNTTFFNFDISYNMIRIGLVSRNFHGIAADLEHLPIRQGATELILSLTALQNTADIEKALTEIRRISSSTTIAFLSFLKKIIEYDELYHHLFQIFGPNFTQIPYSGEDYIFKFHN